MIELTIKAIRPFGTGRHSFYPTTTTNTPPYIPTPTAQPVKSIQTESIRRDNIIKRLNKECLFNTGDVVVPVSDEAFKDFGEIRVLSIMSSYAQMGKDEKWPENDNPMIVHAKPLDIGKPSFYCTTNYLKPKYPTK